ncbi:hypothetical protein PQO01_13880 [Lentisphaera marina]|uniref:hypothetical protein n=1 Tax=Lentisphaera marina TaxID=1111041 RepID=UPI002366B5A2|nr:hypothetical protein [Lentisphaera marina]MDD7986036.1 hypothetical protein [Lentisphaera marina]
MKNLVLSLLFSFSLFADSVLFNDGKKQEGNIAWSASGFSIDNKKLNLAELLKVAFDRPLISNEGEYIIFTDGSMIKAQSTKLLNDEKALLIDYRGEEKKLSLSLISSISFQGAHYFNQAEPGFYTLNDFHYPGEAAYFTKSSIGQNKPSKKRHKKALLNSLHIQKITKSSSEYVFYTTSREIIYGKLVKQSSETIQIETVFGIIDYPTVEIIQLAKNHVSISSEDIKEIKYTAFIDQCRELNFNKSCTNSQILDQGFSTTNFISMHSRTEFVITPRAGTRALLFSTTFDPLSHNGHVHLSISQNGTSLLKKAISSSEFHSDLFVAVRQGEIRVLLDYGKGGSAGDYFILLNPQFIGVQ